MHAGARSILGRAALAAVIGLALTTGSALAQDGPRLETVIGSVEIGTGEPPVWRPARQGDRLQPGDRLRTGADGRVELVLPTGSARLYEHSILRIPDDWAAARDESVELDRGSSLFDIERRGRSFEVRTPEAIAMVKGTQFSVSVDHAGVAVAVFRGLVGVRSPSAELLHEVLVRPGATAVGGGSLPFTLRWVEQKGDPWESWSRGDSHPELPAKLIDNVAKGASLSGARSEANAAVDRKIKIRDISKKQKGKKGKVRRAIFEAKKSAAEEVGESLAESALGPGGWTVNVVKGGGSNYINLTPATGPSTQLQKDDLKDVTKGDLTKLDPTILSLLVSQSIDPIQFAEIMLHLF